MDGRDTRDLGSYFTDNHHHHHRQLVDGTASSPISGKGIFSAPSSAAGDANPFSIPQIVTPRPSQARPSAIATAAAESAKRKRGRPRKYGALPSIPPVYLPTSAMSGAANASTSRLSSSSSSRKKEASSKSSSKKSQLAALGNAGQGFTPHVIAVSAGEDLVNKLVSMMEQWGRAVCILSATGSVLNPSLRQSASSGSYVTYEGMFEIISLFGTLAYTKAGGTSSRTCGLGICLSRVDGHVVGGGVEGPLMAAGPVQVIAGSFLININTDFSASANADGFTNKVSTEATTAAEFAPPIGMESILGSSRRITSSAGSDEHQSMGGGYHLFHSRPFFLSPEWEGRRFGGPSGTSQSADDEDEEYIGD
ncbi:hypothetical protein KSP39_PZI017676 [Platanthera zijinensis]|uniref:AT-hook motif nuclear-localized protein n=1 Tax=Platanthera zijinensis TaxID=2320716 RepID=A0AAP0B640_9ASPA